MLVFVVMLLYGLDFVSIDLLVIFKIDQLGFINKNIKNKGLTTF